MYGSSLVRVAKPALRLYLFRQPCRSRSGAKDVQGFYQKPGISYSDNPQPKTRKWGYQANYCGLGVARDQSQITSLPMPRGDRCLQAGPRLVTGHSDCLATVPCEMALPLAGTILNR